MDLPLSPVAVMGRAQQPRPAPRLAVGASPHFSPQQLALADTGCQPLCSLVTPVEEVRWCRLPFHKRAPLPFSGKGMSCQWAMAARLKTPRKNGPGIVFWFLTRIGKVSPPHPPADSWKTVERTLEATERLCDDRDSIAHRRREVQVPSPRTRLTTHPQTTDFHQRRHAGADKKRLAPNLPATQRANLPNPWRCSSFPINGRPSTAPQGSPTSLELLWRHAHKETSSCGEPARPGRRDAGGIFADGHPPHGPITGGALSLARLGGASNQYAAS